MRPIQQKNPEREGRLVEVLRYVPPICIFMGDQPHIKLEKHYQRELEKRGIVSQECWSKYKVESKVKEVFDRILKHRMWSQKADFHPEDPYFIIGGLQTGDLSEAEVLMDLEDEFKIKVPEDMVNEWAKMNYADVLESFTAMVQPNESVKPSP